jgi:hypothetical protein
MSKRGKQFGASAVMIVITNIPFAGDHRGSLNAGQF